MWGASRARAAFVAVTVLGHLAFVAAVPALTRWTTAHPLASRALFNDFPPWPWLSVAILGLVLGWSWLETRAQGPDAERRFFIHVAVVGAGCVLGYLAWEWWIPTSPRFGFPRDFTLNNHAAGIALLLSAMYALMERRQLRAPWLVTLGQTALLLVYLARGWLAVKHRLPG